MLIESLIAVTLVAALVVFLTPEAYAPQVAFALSLLPLAGSLFLWTG